MTRTRTRQRRGVAMLAVLVALLLLTVLASGFFMQARDLSTLANVSTAQTISLNNAEMGLQEAVRRIRGAQVPPVAVLTCTTADVDLGLCMGTYTVGPVMGTTSDPMNGGGALYQFIIYRRPAAADPGLPPNRYVVRVTGFYGDNPNSEAVITSILEAEVDMGVGFRTTCVGGYECS